jgi:exodeoxyribonuclease VII small subunit
MSKEKGTKSGSFESSLKRLEEIVSLLDAGSISLDESLKLYEEGVKLSKKCLEKLNGVETRLKRLERTARGDVRLTEEDIDQ